MRKKQILIENKQGVFSFIYSIKSKFCNKIIIKLDRIISKCADKKQKEEIDNKLNDLENFQQFSEVFNENKSLLEQGINDLKLTNNLYEQTLKELYFHFTNNDYVEMKRIFNELGLK